MDNILIVSAVQIKPRGSVKHAVEHAFGYVETAAEKEVDVICLPESWVLVRPYPEIEKLCRHSETIIEGLCRIAREYGTNIIMGAIYEKVDERCLVSCPVADRSGEIVGIQGKVHLFEEEKCMFQSDSNYSIFKLDGYRVGIMICYDMAFPEVARILTLKGAEIIFNPSRIKREGTEPWHTYLKARCLENRVPIVGVNIADPPAFTGGSIILQAEMNPKTEITYPKALAVADEYPGILTAEIDIKAPEGIRRRRLKDRVTKTYNSILEEFVSEA